MKCFRHLSGLARLLCGSGASLLVANQRSGTMNVYSVDPASGKVTATGQAVEIATPMSVAVVEALSG